MMMRKIMLFVLCVLTFILTGCFNKVPEQASSIPKTETTAPITASAQQDKGRDASPPKDAEPSKGAQETPAAPKPSVSDYKSLDRDAQNKLLLNSVWQKAGEGNFKLGYYTLPDTDLAGKRFYYRFYPDFTMHEWSDNASWNRLYKWVWTKENTITVTNYADKTGQSASSWYFDAKYLLNHNLNTQDLTPMMISEDYPKEPPINK